MSYKGVAFQNVFEGISWSEEKETTLSKGCLYFLYVSSRRFLTNQRGNFQ